MQKELDKPKVSFIVPVYNVADYLRKCVQSILAQTYQNFEVCLVDDGSTDSSGVICEELRSIDHRIRVVHQTNGGVTSARKTGVKHAKGDFLYFVDSDDSISPDTLSCMLSYMNDDIDMVCEWNDNCILNRDDFCHALFHQKGWNVFGKLYRKTLFHADTFSVSRYFKIGEDFLMQLRLARFIDGQIVGINTQKYHYNTSNPTSAMANYVRSYEYEVNMLNEVAKIVVQIPSSQVIRRAYFDFRLCYLAGMIGFQYPINYQEKWVQDILSESSQYDLTLLQIVQLKAVNIPLYRLIFIADKKLRALLAPIKRYYKRVKHP